MAGYALLGLGSLATYYLALALGLRGQRVLQAEHLDDGRQPLPGEQPRSRIRPTTSSTWGSTSALCWRRSSPRGCLQTLAGSDVLEVAKKGKTLSPEQAASLRRGFLTAFYAAAVGMTLGTVVFAVFYRKLAAADRRHAPLKSTSRQTLSRHRGPRRRRVREIGDRAGPRIDSDHRACSSSTPSSIVFWMVFHQNGSTMTYWADENTAWNVSGVVSNAINPFWIVVLSIPLVNVWGWLRKRGLEPSTPAKMAHRHVARRAWRS